MDREVTFSLGKKSINLKVEPIEMVQNQIHLSEKVVQEFCLPFHPLKLQVNYIRCCKYIMVWTDYRIIN